MIYNYTANYTNAQPYHGGGGLRPPSKRWVGHVVDISFDHCKQIGCACLFGKRGSTISKNNCYRAVVVLACHKEA